MASWRSHAQLMGCVDTHPAWRCTSAAVPLTGVTDASVNATHLAVASSSGTALAPIASTGSGFSFGAAQLHSVPSTACAWIPGGSLCVGGSGGLLRAARVEDDSHGVEWAELGRFHKVKPLAQTHADPDEPPANTRVTHMCPTSGGVVAAMSNAVARFAGTGSAPAWTWQSGAPQPIAALALHDEAPRVACGGALHLLSPSGQPQAVLKAPAPITAIDCCPAVGSLVAVACGDATVRIFDVRMPGAAPVDEIATGQAHVTGVRWLPSHAGLLASVGLQGGLRVWSLFADAPHCVGRLCAPLRSEPAAALCRAAEPGAIAVVGRRGAVLGVRPLAEFFDAVVDAELPPSGAARTVLRSTLQRDHQAATAAAAATLGPLLEAGDLAAAAAVLHAAEPWQEEPWQEAPVPYDAVLAAAVRTPSALSGVADAADAVALRRGKAEIALATAVAQGDADLVRQCVVEAGAEPLATAPTLGRVVAFLFGVAAQDAIAFVRRCLDADDDDLSTTNAAVASTALLWLGRFPQGVPVTGGASPPPQEEPAVLPRSTPEARSLVEFAIVVHDAVAGGGHTVHRTVADAAFEVMDVHGDDVLAQLPDAAPALRTAIQSLWETNNQSAALALLALVGTRASVWRHEGTTLLSGLAAECHGSAALCGRLSRTGADADGAEQLHGFMTRCVRTVYETKQLCGADMPSWLSSGLAAVNDALLTLLEEWAALLAGAAEDRRGLAALGPAVQAFAEAVEELAEGLDADLAGDTLDLMLDECDDFLGAIE